MFFLHWKAIYENAYKGLHKATEDYWNSFQNVNLECQLPLSVFLPGKIIFEFFLAEGHIILLVTSIRIYRKYHVFLEKDHLSFSVQRKNITFSGKNTIFPYNTRSVIFLCNYFEKTIFSEHLKKISYFHVFFF